MSPINKIAAAVLGLAALASAAPALAAHPSDSWYECPAGSGMWFQKCINGVACSDENPCRLPPVGAASTDSSSTTTTSDLALATPSLNFDPANAFNVSIHTAPTFATFNIAPTPSPSSDGLNFDPANAYHVTVPTPTIDSASDITSTPTPSSMSLNFDPANAYNVSAHAAPTFATFDITPTPTPDSASASGSNSDSDSDSDADSDSTESSDAPSVCQTSKIFKPTMWNIAPSQPDSPQQPVSHIQVSVWETDPEVQQVVAFEGILSKAKTCTLMWAQADASDRTFFVTKSGLIDYTQLSGFPSDKSQVTSNTIASFENDNTAMLASGQADFTSWDKSDQGASEHIVGAVDCAENLYFKIKTDTLNGDGRVFMEQDDSNGFFISYTTC